MKPQQPQIKAKRRGTIKLSESKGPPEGLFNVDNSILTIGDGDLSFSVAVSNWLLHLHPQSELKFIATTYDTFQELNKLYSPSTMAFIRSQLHRNKVKVFHEIDVQKLLTYDQITGDKYDRIVWNFPHAGFPPKSHGPGFEWQQQSYQKHTSLIDCFFKYSSAILTKGGLVIMSHKTVKPFGLWNIPQIALKNEYKLIQSHKFDIDDYPGYSNRRGAGKNGGKTFPMEDAITYVFKLQ